MNESACGDAWIGDDDDFLLSNRYKRHAVNLLH